MIIAPLPEPALQTLSYLIVDPASRMAALIDPVPARVHDDIALLAEHDAELVAVLLTQRPSDETSSAWTLHQRFPAASILAPRTRSRSWVTCPVSEDDVVTVGSLVFSVLGYPCQEPDAVAYVARDHRAAFIGEMLPLLGCAQGAMNEGEARCLYRNVHDRLFRLDGDTVLYPSRVCGALAKARSTVADEKLLHTDLCEATDEDAFVARVARVARSSPTAHPTAHLGSA